MTAFDMRALEMHSGYVWNWDRVVAALEFVERHEMTTLVLHRNDIVDLVVYPGATFGASGSAANIFERYRDIYTKLYKYTPTRRSGPYQRRDYLKRVLELARRKGIEVYLENKELFFADIFLELYPELTKNGTPCPSHPFWWDFIRTKYTELFQDLPEIAGIITAPGTGESRLAVSSNRCTCEDCRSGTPQQWYRNLLMAMHEPITNAGGKLVVRDFVFDRQAQTELAETIEGLPTDVIVSLKNTPHDYYPTFPDNPRLGDVGAHPQWIEFDAMGQYFGWGVAPAILIEDYRARLERASAKGVEGVIFRTDWESLDGHSAFANLNLINVHAGAALSRDRGTAAKDIYRRWLDDEGHLAPEADASARDAAAQWTEDLLKDCWTVVSKALFVQDCVFSDSSNYPVSLEHAFWLAETKNSLKDWVPEKADALATDPDNLALILSEKDEALALVRALRARGARQPEGLTNAAHAMLVEALEVFELYVSGWHAVVRAIMLTRSLLDNADAGPASEAERLVADELARLMELSGTFRAFAAATDLRFVVYNMLGWERLETLHADLTQKLENRAEWSSTARQPAGADA
jgi:hypothetical protein